MALPILDGNQSATTLSTILSSGQHIPAHTVVSLGTQAISNITSAVSGTAVTFGLVGGTVTANNFTLTNVLQYDGSHYFLKVGGVATTGGTSFPVYVAGSVTVGNSVTIGFLPAISGTVTVGNSVTIGSLPAISGTVSIGNLGSGITTFWAQNARSDITIAVNDGIDSYITDFGGMLISGTVSIGNSVTIGLLPALAAGTNQIGSVTASISGTVPISISSVTVGNSVTIGSLPAISGTVTANTFALQGTAVTTSNFTSTTASTVLANYNATREVLTIFNEGAGNLHIAPGATCTTIAYQVRLSAGDYYEVPNHQTTITHSAVFATAGTARICQLS
jgi:acyl-[acyl carrier protein]--UDP-N-acetylglucosamine O-acyltransferase